MGRPKGSKNKVKENQTKDIPEVKKPANFRISLTLGDRVLVGEGETPLDALEAIETPLKIVTKGFLLVEKGDRQRRQLLMPLAVKRLFYPKSRIFLAKALGVGL